MNSIEQLYAITRWITGRGVSVKIGLGFGIVLALHLAVVAMSHYGVHHAEVDRRKQATLLSQVETFYEIDRLVGELQRTVLLFAFTGYEGPAQRVESLQERLEDALDRAARSEASGVDPGSIDQMRQRLAAHREIFGSVIADRAKRRSLLDNDLARRDGEFEAAVRSLDPRVQQDEQLTETRAAFHAAELDALRFVINPDSALARRAKERLRLTRRLLDDAATRLGEDLAGASAAVDGYEQAFVQMVQSTRGYLHLVNVVLAGESEELLYLAKEVRNACSARADELTADMRTDARRFEAANTAVSVLTIVLGLVASWLIGRDVAPPLNEITQTFDRLARGEPCDTVPGLDRRDELGRLAHAAEVFRAKAAQTEQLLSEVTRMKESERQLAHSHKMESIGQLAAGIAHEINTPMQAVANNVEYLAGATECLLSTVQTLCEGVEDPAAGDSDWRERMRRATRARPFCLASKQTPLAINETAAAAGRVVEIVRAMKAMSHPGTTELQPTDVNQVIRDAATISRNRWKFAAEVELELDENVPHPPALGSTLSQVVLNLVVNAADAIVETRDEGGPLGAITIRSYTDGGSVYVEVQDTGGGVPEAIRDRIFEPFFTTKDVGKGTGQGLAFCYDAVVRRHHGELRLDSTPGVGATFTVRLPVDPAPAEVGSACKLEPTLEPGQAV